MRIEEGKFYRTREGRKVGPVRATDNSFWPMECGGTWWRANGESCEGSMARMYPRNDIISEWIESPVRTETVTTRRIEPGVYGRIRVRDEAGMVDGGTQVGFNFVARNGASMGQPEVAYLSAPELRELARVALEIAEYLDAK